MIVTSGWIKTRCVDWIRQEMAKQCRATGKTANFNVIMGNDSHVVGKWINSGTDFIYLDHAYFKRGWANKMFRAVRGKLHMTETRKRPDDRLKKLGVQIEPWRKERGPKVVVIPTYMTHEAIYGDRLRRWESETVARLKTLTDRPIVVKREKGNLREYLKDAWALVGTGTVASVEAALMGVPVFVTDLDPSWPINAGPLENIERPEFPDRHDWACTLSYASWHATEIDEVNWIDYDYALRDHLPS